MIDNLELWIKSHHIIAVIAWMAALLYLPRLFIYHCEAQTGSDKSETFKVMERRLIKAIGTPSMIATWIFGIWVASLYGYWGEPWLWVKLVCVLAMTVIHFRYAGDVKAFAQDRNARTQKHYRIMNEVPAVFMIVVVIMVVVKPF